MFLRQVDDCLAQYGMRPPAKLAAEGILMCRQLLPIVSGSMMRIGMYWPDMVFMWR